MRFEPGRGRGWSVYGPPRPVNPGSGTLTAESALVIGASGVVLPARELEFVASRASGPGGQAVNKTSSRITLRWNPAASGALTPAQKARVREKLGYRIGASGCLQVHVESERSQYRNREIARERLAELVARALRREKKRRATRPTRASRERRLEDKRRQSRKKAERRSGSD